MIRIFSPLSLLFFLLLLFLPLLNHITMSFQAQSSLQQPEWKKNQKRNENYHLIISYSWFCRRIWLPWNESWWIDWMVIWSDENLRNALFEGGGSERSLFFLYTRLFLVDSHSFPSLSLTIIDEFHLFNSIADTQNWELFAFPLCLASLCVIHLFLCCLHFTV